MFGLRPKYPPVAVEIGDGYASAVKVQRRRSHPRLLHWHGIDLPYRRAEAEGLGDSLVLDDELRPRFEELIAELGRIKMISIAFPDTAVRTFFLEIENRITSARELREMILFKISKLAPISIEGTALSYQRLRPRDGGGDHYLALLASRRLISSYEDFLARKGIHLGLIESSSLAAANLFESLLSREFGDCALLRIEDNHFNVALFRDGMLIFSRTRIRSKEEDVGRGVTAEMRTLSLFAQDKLGSQGIRMVYVYGPGDAPLNSVAALEAKGFAARRLSLDDIVEVPAELRRQPGEQGALAAAAGSALRR
jgi:Tfp pilus assembly PilM family ATPase